MRRGRTKNAPKSIRLGRAQIAPKEHYNCAQSTLHLLKTLTCAQGAPKMCLESITPVENIHAQGHRLAPEAHYMRKYYLDVPDALVNCAPGTLDL